MAFCPITNNCAALLHVAAHVREVLRFKSFAKPSFDSPLFSGCIHASRSFTISRSFSRVCLTYARRCSGFFLPFCFSSFSFLGTERMHALSNAFKRFQTRTRNNRRKRNSYCVCREFMRVRKVGHFVLFFFFRSTESQPVGSLILFLTEDMSGQGRS